MNTTRQFLLDNDTGSDRLKFEYDFNYGYENKQATFTCRRCGKHEYRNGEFETIKMGDIFTHITHFPSGASPGGDNLCTQCLDVHGDPNPTDHKETKPILATKNHNNNNSLSGPGTPVPRDNSHPSDVDQLGDAISVPASGSNIQSNPTITYSVLSTVYGDNQYLTTNSTSIGNNQDSSHFHNNSAPPEPKYTINMVNSVLETSQSSGDSSTTFIISHTQQQPQVKQEPSISTTQSSPIVNINNVRTPEGSTTPGLSNITNNNTNSKECQICKKTFKSNKIAQLHYQRVHEKIGRYCCHICGIRFSYRGSLDSHLASHTTPEVTHNCPACGQKFKEKSNLTNHMKIHSDNPKKFLCDFCPSGFSKRVNLRYHMKRKHPDQVMNTTNTSSGPNNNNNNNNNTQLSGMSAPQSQPTQLSNMSQTYSPLNPPTTKTPANSKDKPQGNFKCEHCGRTFLFKNNLKAHLRTHTRDKKYTCEICEKSFIYKESLKNHMLLHSNELPYLCDICGKKFRDRSNRRKHVKNVHKYMFMNGDASTAAGPPQNSVLVKNGENSTASVDPSNNYGQQVQQNPTDPNPPKKKRNNKKNNPPDINDNKRTIIKSTATNYKKRSANNSMSASNNSKANSNPRNNNKSVIVSTASNIASSLGVDQDRKIIMSPSPKGSNSPLEYSHLPVTVHVPASPAGGLHQHYVSTNRNHNVIVKASSTSSPPDMDLYHRSQNVIVYPKSKGNINVINDYTQQNTVISHNNMLSSHPQQQQSHVSQPQYYTEDSYEARAAPPTYMTLPLSTLASSPPDSTQNSTMVYEFAHPSQGTPIKIETDNPDQNHSMQAALRYDDSCGGENSETVQYSSSIYSTSGGEPNYHMQHHPEPEHQYWTVAPQNETNNTNVAIPTNVSPPYSTPSSTNSASVSYDSPITAASNVLNAPSYAQPDIVDPVNSNFFYKDLSQFDFSYL